jgi:MarR family transcriptional regulator, organic hydroperoxide resistance regulator
MLGWPTIARTDAVTHATPAPLPDGVREDEVTCTLRRAAKAQAMLVASLLTDAGVYPGQELLLQELWDRGPQSQAELATALQLDPSTVTKTLQRLERNGLIARCPSELDRRAHVVSTTIAGDTLRDTIQQAIVETERRAVAGLSQEEVAELARLLGRVHENLCLGKDRSDCS